jgi:hypothetical protein
MHKACKCDTHISKTPPRAPESTGLTMLWLYLVVCRQAGRQAGLIWFISTIHSIKAAGLLLVSSCFEQITGNCCWRENSKTIGVSLGNGGR